LPGPKGPGLHETPVGRVLLDPPSDTRDLGEILGGAWHHADGRRCFVVVADGIRRRFTDGSGSALAERLDRAAASAMFTGGARGRRSCSSI
jgi:hypothetical protein